MRFCQHLSCCTGGRHTKQKTLLLFRSLETNLWQSKKIFYFTVYFCASIVVHKKLGSPCRHEYVKENTPTIELLLLGTAKSDLLIIFVTYSLINFVLIFCCAFRCNISHLLKIVFSFVQWHWCQLGCWRKSPMRFTDDCVLLQYFRCICLKFCCGYK